MVLGNREVLEDVEVQDDCVDERQEEPVGVGLVLHESPVGVLVGVEGFVFESGEVLEVEVGFCFEEGLDGGGDRADISLEGWSFLGFLLFR